MIWFTSFLVSFVYIFLKASQQLNVVKGHYIRTIPVAYMLAFCEVSIIALVAKESVWLFLPIGTGGFMGAMLSMKLNRVPVARKGFRQ